MSSPTRSEAESERLRILDQYPLDRSDENRLNRIARLAAEICDAPIGLVSIVEENRQVYIGRAGMDVNEGAREHSFCAHAMGQVETMVVNDATIDARFESSPLVTGDMGIRFYAGQPLVSPEGQPLGALCVIDHAARNGLTSLQADALATLGEVVMSLLEGLRADARAELARSQSMIQVAELEQRFAVLADSLPQLVWSTAADGSADYFNGPWCDFTGLPNRASFGNGWLSLLHPEDAPVAAQAWNRAVATLQSYEVRYRLRRHDRSYRWVIARGLPLFDPDGKVVRWIGTCTDIDDEMANADALELLSQELHHRIKNIFAVIGGLVSLSSRSHPNAADFAAELYGRILALGRAHAFVGSPGSRSDGTTHGGLKGMLEELLSPYMIAGSNRITITGDEIAVDDRSATPLSLVFHELATNSAKYGALGVEVGTVEIALEAGDMVCLRWIEHGIAKTGEAMPGGFGSRLIDMSINRQLGGSYITTWGEGSLEMAISIPSGNVQRA